MRYCTCRSTIGYASLNDMLNTFVCVECNKPSYLVYLKSEKDCVECGVSIFNPWEYTCSPCRDELIVLSDQCESKEEYEQLLENVTDYYWTWENQAERVRILCPGSAPHVSPKGTDRRPNTRHPPISTPQTV